MQSGYHQVKLHASDIPKTVFRKTEGLFERLVMPSGLSNDPGIHQRVINDVFRDLLGKIAVAHDILAYSKEPD